MTATTPVLPPEQRGLPPAAREALRTTLDETEAYARSCRRNQAEAQARADAARDRAEQQEARARELRAALDADTQLKLGTP